MAEFQHQNAQAGAGNEFFFTFQRVKGGER